MSSELAPYYAHGAVGLVAWILEVDLDDDRITGIEERLRTDMVHGEGLCPVRARQSSYLETDAYVLAADVACPVMNCRWPGPTHRHWHQPTDEEEHERELRQLRQLTRAPFDPQHRSSARSTR